MPRRLFFQTDSTSHVKNITTCRRHEEVSPRGRPAGRPLLGAGGENEQRPHVLGWRAKETYQAEPLLGFFCANKRGVRRLL